MDLPCLSVCLSVGRSVVWRSSEQVGVWRRLRYTTNHLQHPPGRDRLAFRLRGLQLEAPLGALLLRSLDEAGGSHTRVASVEAWKEGGRIHGLVLSACGERAHVQ